MAKLFAIADLHLGHNVNSEEWQKLRPQSPGSGLILAGDLGESSAHLDAAFTKAKECFEHVFWVPGNHELYTMPSTSSVSKSDTDQLRGEAKYLAFVELARSHSVLTPEDPWMVWKGKPGEEAIIALCFTLYDYSFRPEEVKREKALEWALEKDVEATDEALLHPDPYDSRDAWCHALCDKWERKFSDYTNSHPNVPFVIVNHWPLREDLVYIPLIPRFSLWCGTKRSSDWHRKKRFGAAYGGAKAAVTGHLHVRRTDHLEGCRFEEVSLGYPRQWAAAKDKGKGINDLLREIIPGPATVSSEQTQWRRYG